MCRMDWNEKMQKDEKKLYFKPKVTSSWVKIVGIWKRIKIKKKHKNYSFKIFWSSNYRNNVHCNNWNVIQNVEMQS